MSVSRLNSWSGLSHKNEVITRTYGTGALRFKSCARLGEEIRVTAAKCAGGIHSSRAWAVRSNSHAATPQWVMLTGVLMCCGAHLIWVAHNAPNLSNTESQDIPPPPTTWNGIAPRPHPPPLVYLRLLLLSPPLPCFLLLHHLLLFAALSSQLGSAADRSPGFSLLGQNGGGGLSVNERSRDCMTGSACAP